MMINRTGQKRKEREDIEQQEELLTLASDANKITRNVYTSVIDGQPFKKFQGKNEFRAYRDNNRTTNKFKKNLADIEEGKLPLSERAENLVLIEAAQRSLESVFMTYFLRNLEHYSKIYHNGSVDLYEDRAAAKQLVEKQIHAILLSSSWLFAVGYKNVDYKQKIQKTFGGSQSDLYFNNIRLDIEKEGLTLIEEEEEEEGAVTLIEKEGSTIKWKEEKKSIYDIYEGYCQKAKEKFENMVLVNDNDNDNDNDADEPNYNNNGPQDKTQQSMKDLIKENSDLKQDVSSLKLEFFTLMSKFVQLEKKVNDLEKNQVNQPQVQLPSMSMLMNSRNGQLFGDKQPGNTVTVVQNETSERALPKNPSI